MQNTDLRFFLMDVNRTTSPIRPSVSCTHWAHEKPARFFGPVSFLGAGLLGLPRSWTRGAVPPGRVTALVSGCRSTRRPDREPVSGNADDQHVMVAGQWESGRVPVSQANQHPFVPRGSRVWKTPGPEGHGACRNKSRQPQKGREWRSSPKRCREVVEMRSADGTEISGSRETVACDMIAHITIHGNTEGDGRLFDCPNPGSQVDHSCPGPDVHRLKPLRCLPR